MPGEIPGKPLRLNQKDVQPLPTTEQGVEAVQRSGEQSSVTSMIIHGCVRLATSLLFLLAAVPSLCFVPHFGSARGHVDLASARAHLGRGTAYLRPHAAPLHMSGSNPNPGPPPPGIDPKTGLPYGYEPPPPPKLNAAQEALIKRVIEKSKNSNKMKRVQFKSSAKSVAKVNDTDVAPNVTLGTYMTLPAEQWVTLDENYISRLDDGASGNAVQYRFTLPLKYFMQLPLTATCDVSVSIDEKQQMLKLDASGARLRASTAEDDALPAPNMTQAQREQIQQQRPPTLPPNLTQSIEQADMQVHFLTPPLTHRMHSIRINVGD